MYENIGEGMYCVQCEKTVGDESECLACGFRTLTPEQREVVKTYSAGQMNALKRQLNPKGSFAV